jgi:hypothetical protein
MNCSHKVIESIHEDILKCQECGVEWYRKICNRGGFIYVKKD